MWQWWDSICSPLSVDLAIPEILTTKEKKKKRQVRTLRSIVGRRSFICQAMRDGMVPFTFQNLSPAHKSIYVELCSCGLLSVKSKASSSLYLCGVPCWLIYACPPCYGLSSHIGLWDKHGVIMTESWRSMSSQLHMDGCRVNWRCAILSVGLVPPSM